MCSLFFKFLKSCKATDADQTGTHASVCASNGATYTIDTLSRLATIIYDVASCCLVLRRMPPRVTPK